VQKGPGDVLREVDDEEAFRVQAPRLWRSTTGSAALDGDPRVSVRLHTPMASLLELAWTTNTSARRADVLEAAVEAAAGPGGGRLCADLAALRRAPSSCAPPPATCGMSTAACAPTSKPGEGLAGAAAQVRELLVVDEPATDPRTRQSAFLLAEEVRGFVGAPLVASYALEGVLGVFSPARRLAVCRHPRGARRAGGPDAALALESARLFADSERRRRAADGLAAVGQALTQSLDPAEVAHLIADSVLALLEARDL